MCSDEVAQHIGWVHCAKTSKANGPYKVTNDKERCFK